MPAGEEIELKLELAAADAAAVIASPLLAALPASRKSQKAIYFDTPDGALREKGVSLRIRSEGGKSIQTMKAAGCGAGLFTRPEWERPAVGDRPVIDAETPLYEHVPGVDRDALRPAFTVQVERAKWILEEGAAKVEIVLDTGEAVNGTAHAPLCELELELKAGPPTALFALARRLDGVAPLRLGVLSKAERGYRLSDGSADHAAKAEPLALDPRMDAMAGFQAIARNCLRQFRLNEMRLAGGPDSGALHQARVGLRRLRSALSLFRTLLADGQFGHMAQELRWLAGSLGLARNIDVLLKRIDDPGLCEGLQRERDLAYAAAAEALASPRARALMLDLAEWIAVGEWTSAPALADLRGQPLSRFAVEALRGSRRRVKKCGKAVEDADDEGRHRLRIAAKKLRYASEFFAGLYATKRQRARHARFLTQLEELQDHLGDLNDLATGAQLMAQFDLLGAEEATALLARQLDRPQLIARSAHALDALLDVKSYWK